MLSLTMDSEGLFTKDKLQYQQVNQYQIHLTIGNQDVVICTNGYSDGNRFCVVNDEGN